MNIKFKNIKLVEYKTLTSLKIFFLLLTIISGICFLSLSTGGITDNAITWFFFKFFVGLLVGVPTFFLLMYIINLLPIDASISAYVKFYKSQLSEIDIKKKYPKETELKIKEHLNYISEIAKFLDKTPKDIENLENEVSSAEGKIRALNRASSVAIGYGAGKKTGM